MTGTEQPVAGARGGLATWLGALQRRGTRVRISLTPSTYLRSPWLRVGLGFVLGYVAGQGPLATDPEIADARRRTDHTLLRNLGRSTILAALKVVLREAITAAERPAAPRHPTP